MSKIGRFDQDIEFLPEDVTRIQEYRREQVDKLVLDAIHTGNVFAGFAIAMPTTTRIVVGEGRLYIAGKDYSREADTATTFTLATGSLTLPVSQFKYFSMIGWGSVQDTENLPREFETLQRGTDGQWLDQTLNEQRDFYTSTIRYANIQLLMGPESANPEPPPVGANQIEIARFLCGPSGVISYAFVEANRVETIEGLMRRVGILELLDASNRAAIGTLISDFASMRALVETLPRAGVQDLLIRDVSRIKEQLGRPDTATTYGAVTFGNTNEVDLAHPHSMCRVDGVATFMPVSENQALLAFQNPNEPAVTKIGNLTLPVFTHELAVDTTAGLTLA